MENYLRERGKNALPVVAVGVVIPGSGVYLTWLGPPHVVVQLRYLYQLVNFLVKLSAILNI